MIQHSSFFSFVSLQIFFWSFHSTLFHFVLLGFVLFYLFSRKISCDHCLPDASSMVYYKAFLLFFLDIIIDVCCEGIFEK